MGDIRCWWKSLCSFHKVTGCELIRKDRLDKSGLIECPSYKCQVSAPWPLAITQKGAIGGLLSSALR
eukprot:6327542-Amphidinium_carterae.1